jgi:hypothetical protein
MSSSVSDIVQRLRVIQEQLSTNVSASSSASSSSSTSSSSTSAFSSDRLRKFLQEREEQDAKDAEKEISSASSSSPALASSSQVANHQSRKHIDGIPRFPKQYFMDKMSIAWGLISGYLNHANRRKLISVCLAFARHPAIANEWHNKFKVKGKKVDELTAAEFEAKWLHAQLMNYAVRGEEKTVLAIANRTPELLLKEGDVIDWSNNTGIHFQGTPMRALLWTDIDAAKKMRPCFAKIPKDKCPDGAQELAKQYHEHFTKESEEQDALWIARGKKAVEGVIKAIQDAEPNDDCKVALDEFKDFLKPRGIVKTGTQSYGYLYAHVLELYWTHYNTFGPHWNAPKQLIMRNKVIGTIERYLSPSLAQAFTHYWEVIIDGKELIRDFNLSGHRNVGGLFWYPLDANPNSIFGDNDNALPRRGCRVLAPLINYLKQKKQLGETFLSPNQPTIRSGPGV